MSFSNTPCIMTISYKILYKVQYPKHNVLTQANFIENVSKKNLHLFNYDYENNDVPYLLERKNEFLDIKNINVKKKPAGKWCIMLTKYICDSI